MKNILPVSSISIISSNKTIDKKSNSPKAFLDNNQNQTSNSFNKYLVNFDGLNRRFSKKA